MLLYDGEIIRYAGGGTLSIFKSAVHATMCAISIQGRLRQGTQVPLRIGLHVGDIVIDTTEVYGEAIDLASKIEGLGLAASVLISAAVNYELRNYTSISTTSLRYYHWKNIAEGVEVFAITNDSLLVPQRSTIKWKRHHQVKRSLSSLEKITQVL
jgi:class 3 adenylate cyclase